MNEQIARGEALRDALLYAPLQHFFVDTVQGPGSHGWIDAVWHARCNCGFRTLGYADPDRAITVFEKWHLGRAR